MARAVAADRSQDLASATTAYIDAIAAAPSSGTPKRALLQMIAAHGMPHSLSAAQLTLLSAAAEPFSARSADANVTLLELDGGLGRGLESLVDPQNQWPFPLMVAAYAPDAADPSRSALVCSVHYQTPEDREFAEHVGRLLVLMHGVLIRRTGHMPSYESPFNVWLSRNSSTTPGGEQWRNNIYLYNLADSRSSIEWVREIAHEYSHLAFPSLGGAYTAPEAWANGYAGERLLVRWLDDPALAGPTAVESAWGRTFGGYANFQAMLIKPAVRAFADRGLSADALGRRDEAGMRYLIGMLLWVDENRGGKALGDLLWNMDNPDPSTLLAAVKQLGAPGPDSQRASARALRHTADGG